MRDGAYGVERYSSLVLDGSGVTHISSCDTRSKLDLTYTPGQTLTALTGSNPGDHLVLEWISVAGAVACRVSGSENARRGCHLLFHATGALRPPPFRLHRMMKSEVRFLLLARPMLSIFKFCPVT